MFKETNKEGCHANVLYCLFKFRVKEAIDVVYWADYFELKLRYANFNFTKHDGTQSGRLKSLLNSLKELCHEIQPN